MNTMSNVVEQLATQLAEQRRITSRRHAAYVALAKVILSDDEPDLLAEPDFERQPMSIGRDPRAA